MDPVLIFTDTERIEKEQAFLTAAVPYLQSLYDAFQGLGLTVGLSELKNIHQSLNPYTSYGSLREEGSSNDALYDLVLEKLTIKAGEQNFNGVPISREKLKGLIEVPDLSPVRNPVKSFHQNNSHAGLSIRLNLLVLANGVVSKAAGADAALAAEFTFHTLTEKGAAIATGLNQICDALNNWENQFPAATYGSNFGVNGQDLLEILPGVVYGRGKQFVPSLQFIRQRE